MKRKKKSKSKLNLVLLGAFLTLFLSSFWLSIPCSSITQKVLPHILPELSKNLHFQSAQFNFWNGLELKQFALEIPSLTTKIQSPHLNVKICTFKLLAAKIQICSINSDSIQISSSQDPLLWLNQKNKQSASPISDFLNLSDTKNLLKSTIQFKLLDFQSQNNLIQQMRFNHFEWSPIQSNSSISGQITQINQNQIRFEFEGLLEQEKQNLAINLDLQNSSQNIKLKSQYKIPNQTLFSQFELQNILIEPWAKLWFKPAQITGIAQIKGSLTSPVDQILNPSGSLQLSFKNLNIQNLSLQKSTLVKANAPCLSHIAFDSLWSSTPLQIDKGQINLKGIQGEYKTEGLKKQIHLNATGLYNMNKNKLNLRAQMQFGPQIASCFSGPVRLAATDIQGGGEKLNIELHGSLIHQNISNMSELAGSAIGNFFGSLFR